MASVTKIVGTAVELAQAGSSLNWTNESKATANDGSYAEGAGDLQNLGYMDYLHGTMNGNVFSIAADQQIDGIVVDIEWTLNGTSSGQSEVQKVILTSSLGDGDDKTDNYVLTTSEVLRSYGSSSDTWGLSLTPAVVNATDFGVKTSCVETLNGNGKKPRVDYIQITVYHSDAPTFKPKPRMYYHGNAHQQVRRYHV